MHKLWRLYALASAAGLVVSLGRTWYAPAPAAPAPDGAIGEMPDTISHFQPASATVSAPPRPVWDESVPPVY